MLDPACPPTVDATNGEVVLLVADGHGLWAELVLPEAAAARWVEQLASAVTAALHDGYGSAEPSGECPDAEPGHSEPW